MRSAWPNSRPAARALVCSAAVVLAVATSLTALVPTTGDAAEKPNGSAPFARPDSSLLLIWNTARELLDQDRHSDAVRLLVSILEADEDYFIAAERPDGSTGGRPYKSLKNEVRSLLGRLAPAAREAYELQFGPMRTVCWKRPWRPGTSSGLPTCSAAIVTPPRVMRRCTCWATITWMTTAS